MLLLEAGGDDEPYNYQVPGFHVHASEDERLRWDFFVRHYANETQQKRDEKFVPECDGVLYPRSGTLGGCTAHHAMIIVYPHNSGIILLIRPVTTLGERTTCAVILSNWSVANMSTVPILKAAMASRGG